MLQRFANNSPSTYIHPRLCLWSWAIWASDPPYLSWKMLEYCWGVSGHPEVAKNTCKDAELDRWHLTCTSRRVSFSSPLYTVPETFPSSQRTSPERKREEHTGCRHSHSRTACRRAKKSPPAVLKIRILLLGFTEEEQEWFLCQRDSSLQCYASGSLCPVNLANCK